MRSELGVVKITEWNEQHLEELARKMGLRRTPGQGRTPIHLALFGPVWCSQPFLNEAVGLATSRWESMGYTETDRVSVVQYLGGLKCRTDGALSTAAHRQHPLSLELAKLLIDAGAFDKGALSIAAANRHPLTPELAKLLIDAGCDPTAQDGNGWDALVHLVYGGYPADPQVTDLFLSAGCRTDLDARKYIAKKLLPRFDQILKEHAEWKEQRDRMVAENSPADLPRDLDWRW